MKSITTLRSNGSLRASLIIAISAALAVLHPSASQAAGRSVAPVINTILNGKGAPLAALGKNGDFYIDRTNLLMYGPKAKNKWPKPFSLKAPAVSSGSSGGNGSQSSGASVTGVITTSGAKGETGAAGQRGLTGATGATGAQGDKGEKGERGEKGDPGVAGPAGLPGAAGANGVGSPGATGATGATGPAGAIGAKGDTGPSAASYGLITFVNPISNPFTFQDSNPFGSFEAGKSYLVEVHLRSTLADGGSGNLGVSFNAVGGLRIVQSNYSISTGNSFRSGASKLETTALAKLLVTVDSLINPKIVITASSGNASSGNVQTLTGFFVAQEVGQVA